MITFVVWLYLIKTLGPEEAFQNLNKKIFMQLFKLVIWFLRKVVFS
jgi:hypothetical protein